MGNWSSRSKVISSEVLIYRPKPESFRPKCLVKSSEILIKRVCNIPRYLSDNVTIIVIIKSRSLSNDAMVRRNKWDECVSYPVLLALIKRNRHVK